MPQILLRMLDFNWTIIDELKKNLEEMIFLNWNACKRSRQQTCSLTLFMANLKALEYSDGLLQFS